MQGDAAVGGSAGMGLCSAMRSWGCAVQCGAVRCSAMQRREGAGWHSAVCGGGLHSAGRGCAVQHCVTHGWRSAGTVQCDAVRCSAGLRRCATVQDGAEMGSVAPSHPPALGLPSQTASPPTSRSGITSAVTTRPPLGPALDPSAHPGSVPHPGPPPHIPPQPQLPHTDPQQDGTHPARHPRTSTQPGAGSRGVLAPQTPPKSRQQV